jgi:hypothetical protein
MVSLLFSAAAAAAAPQLPRAFWLALCRCTAARTALLLFGPSHFVLGSR